MKFFLMFKVLNVVTIIMYHHAVKCDYAEVVYVLAGDMYNFSNWSDDG